MIPGKHSNTNSATIDAQEKEQKIGNFSIFDPIHFIRRLLKNWYWFLLVFLLGYVIARLYNTYYAQRIYASEITLSVSNDASSVLTPNQSINFIWGQGGNTDALYLKKMLLSRSHNEFMVKELKLYTKYVTQGKIRQTHLDKFDSPVLFEVDENHLQQTGYPVTIVEKGNNRFEVSFPEEGHSQELYNYQTETYEQIPAYAKPANKIISVNEWYEAPNIKFRLIPNLNQTTDLELPNVIVALTTVNNAVQNLIANMDVSFDNEIPSILRISKKGYNLNETVNFLNSSVEILKEKRLRDKSLVDKNTKEYLDKNLANIRVRLDSAANVMNNLKVHFPVHQS